MTDEELYTIEAMSKYGGSFVKSLADCFVHADPINFVKLKNTFSNYWSEYSEMADKKICPSKNHN